MHYDLKFKKFEIVTGREIDGTQIADEDKWHEKFSWIPLYHNNHWENLQNVLSSSLLEKSKIIWN